MLHFCARLWAHKIGWCRTNYLATLLCLFPTLLGHISLHPVFGCMYCLDSRLGAKRDSRVVCKCTVHAFIWKDLLMSLSALKCRFSELLPPELLETHASVYSSARGGDLGFFCPTGATSCTNGDDIWHGLCAKYHPPSMQGGGVGPKNRHFTTKFCYINVSHQSILCTIFTNFQGSFCWVNYSNSGRFVKGVPELHGF